MLGNNLVGPLAERGHALADRAAGDPLLLHDRFHARLDRLDLLEPELVDVVGRAVGGGRGLERPGIISVAVLEMPRARVAGRGGAVLLQFLELALERGLDLVAHRRRDPVGQLRVELGFGQLLLERGQDDRLGRIFRRARADDPDRLVEHEIGRDDADAAIVRHALGLAVEIAGIGIDPVGIGRAPGPRSATMHLAVEIIGDFDERAAHLVHDIGRAAIADVGVERDLVAERKGVAIDRGLVRGERDRAVELGGVRSGPRGRRS